MCRISHVLKRRLPVAQQRRDARGRGPARAIEPGAFQERAQAFAELLTRQSFDVLVIDPAQLVAVEARRRGIDMLDVEPFDELLSREYLDVAMTPAETSEEVKHRVGQGTVGCI